MYDGRIQSPTFSSPSRPTPFPGPFSWERGCLSSYLRPASRRLGTSPIVERQTSCQFFPAFFRSANYYGGPYLPRQNILFHGKTYFLMAKLTFPRQNLLFHSKIYYLTAKLTFMAKLRLRDWN